MTKNNFVIKQKKIFPCAAFPDNKRSPLRSLKCNKIGHIHRDCMFKSNSKTYLTTVREKPIDVDVDDVSINRYLFVSCFDSGFSVNIVSKKALRSMKNHRRIGLDRPLTISLLNREKVMFTDKTNLCLEYKGRTAKAGFLIAKNPIMDVVLGNFLSKLLK
ncbi:hypothetical protein CDIK_3604 [Cucumispora dikerogammari]|nr:hypothetical protein CDIK_3604 [Cucumispora dikerogammari]